VGERAAQAYRALRQIQHRARLNEEPTQVDVTAIESERAAGLTLWDTVFKPTLAPEFS
jgi:glutamate-ammonia-ligase adenylyltransferase